MPRSHLILREANFFVVDNMKVRYPDQQLLTEGAVLIGIEMKTIKLAVYGDIVICLGIASRDPEIPVSRLFFQSREVQIPRFRD